MFKEFAFTLEKYAFTENSRKIAVAVSGGVDSMCLALLSSMWAKQNNMGIIALIIDHKLRKESTAEAEWVQRYLKAKNIDSAILTWEGDKPNSNIHNIARKKRYELLTSYCHENNIEHLLIAHHKNDQAETVLQRIKRGSGIRGIAGIQERSRINNIEVIRPLLTRLKSELQSFAVINGWEWIEDPSNQNIKFERVKIRKLIDSLEEKELWVNRICLLAKNAERADRCLDEIATEAFTSCVKFYPFSYAILNHHKFLLLTEEIGLRVINKLLKKISNKTYTPRLKSLMEVYKFLREPLQINKTLSGCEFRLRKAEFIIYRELKDLPVLNDLSGPATFIWDKRYSITCEINNFSIKPLGSQGWASVPKVLKDDISVPLKRILYCTPAVYNEHQEMVCNLFQKNNLVYIEEIK